MTEENKKQFLIPRGFAHGLLVLSDTAEFCYKCDDFYHPNDEGDGTIRKLGLCGLGLRVNIKEAQVRQVTGSMKFH